MKALKQATYLDCLLNSVVHDEEAEDGLTGQDEVVAHGDVADQLDRAEGPGGDGAARGRELHQQSEGDGGDREIRGYWNELKRQRGSKLER